MNEQEHSLARITVSRRDVLRGIRSIARGLGPRFVRLSPQLEPFVSIGTYVIQQPDAVDAAPPKEEELGDSADHGFEKAQEYLRKIQTPGFRDVASLKVSKQLVQCGKDPIHTPSYYIDVAHKNEPWARTAWYEEIALLQAYMGDAGSGLLTAESTHGFPWFYRDLAQAIAGVRDRQAIFDRIHDKLRIDAGSTDDVRQAGYTLELQRQLGLNTPKNLIDRFKKDDKRKDAYSNTYNLELAEAYARAGFPDDALEVWSKTRDTGFHHRTEALSLVTISHARAGHNPSSLINQCIEQTEALKPVPSSRWTPGWKQIEIYVNLAQAAAAYKFAPQPLIALAMKKALEEPSNLRTDGYIHLAKAQISYNDANAQSTLYLARDWMGHVLGEAGKDESGFYEVLRIMNLTDIFHAQLEGRYFGDARTTLQTMERYQDDDGFALMAELSAELAKAQTLSAA